MKKVGDGIVILRNAKEQPRGPDSFHRYRHDSNFYYLSGFLEPEAVMVLIGGKASTRSILFCKEKNKTLELWDGARKGPILARKQFFFDEAYPISKLFEKLPLLLKKKNVFTCIGDDRDWDNTILDMIHQLKKLERKEKLTPPSIADIKPIIHEMRLKKDKHELAIMRQAANISANAHKRVMGLVKEGMWEYEVEAELLYDFNKQGSQSPAYTSIVASGANACTLHYINNNSVLRKSDLLLIDAGCELEGYASDITRTFPVGKDFSGPQKDIYELVLAAQINAINSISAGRAYIRPHEVAVKTLAQGFIDLKLCNGSIDSVLEKEEYVQFYMHGTGHWLGMDVHDVGSYKLGNKWRKLESGMVLTVEPGCYIRPSPKVPKYFWNIGVRIEDDVLVTSSGRSVLTNGVPKTIKEIESLRSIAYGV